MTRDDLTIFDSAGVRAGLSYPDCIRVVRDAMQALSAGTTRQLLRTMLSLGPGRTFAQMPGALGEQDMFGTKTISVFAIEDTGLDISRPVFGEFELEWPPRSGRTVSFPEVDRVEWMQPAVAAEKLTASQRPVIAALAAALGAHGVS